MSVLAVVAVEVKGEATILGKGAQKLGEELYVEDAYLLGHVPQVASEVRATSEVYDGGRESLYKGSGGVGEADEFRAVSQSIVEGASEDEAGIFHGVVVIDVKVSLSLDGEVHARVVGEQV